MKPDAIFLRVCTVVVIIALFAVLCHNAYRSFQQYKQSAIIPYYMTAPVADMTDLGAIESAVAACTGNIRIIVGDSTQLLAPTNSQKYVRQLFHKPHLVYEVYACAKCCAGELHEESEKTVPVAEFTYMHHMGAPLFCGELLVACVGNKALLHKKQVHRPCLVREVLHGRWTTSIAADDA